MGNCDSSYGQNYDMKNYKPEIQPPNYPSPIDIEDLQIYQKEMKNICKIECQNGGRGTGFLCYIPFPDKSHQLPVLITNYHILSEEDISQGKTIRFSINNEEKFYEISINESRKTYTNKETYDITMVELKPKDGIDFHSFLNIDYEAITSKIKFKKNLQIYMLHYPNGNSAQLSLGTIQSITSDNILHFCPTKPGSSGAPIFKSDNKKIIGIHKGAHKLKDKNVGTFIKGPIEEFMKKYNIKKNFIKQNENESSNNNKSTINNEQLDNSLININKEHEKENELGKNFTKNESYNKEKKQKYQNHKKNENKKIKNRDNINNTLPIINPYIDDEIKKYLEVIGDLDNNNNSRNNNFPMIGKLMSTFA